MYREKYDRIAGFYELLERPLDRFFNPLRERAASIARGRTLEIGVGTGKTLRYYPRNVELYAVDGLDDDPLRETHKLLGGTSMWKKKKGTTAAWSGS
ncbi:hypothetical protein [Thermococcus sp. Bubb.Bath]|uniref:hypothetical protein n=1 Tax=Thermococcus sp. Bubb.Bath TaxID=1638242 RepID=UPI001F0EC885|nr:hypothetical protein [Thermococcus sp. Bubb.Bath]